MRVAFVKVIRFIYISNSKKTPESLKVNLENYTLATSYCRQNMVRGGVSISVKNNLKFNQIDRMHHCNE
jgi:hypothetical protein